MRRHILEGMAQAEPPLLDVKVTNPVTYIRRWWAKVIGNEGMELRFKVRPLTAMAIAFVVTTLSLGIGRWGLGQAIPFFRYEEIKPVEAAVKVPTATPEVWRETGFTGTLQYARPLGKYYLITTSSEAIALVVPAEIDLGDYVGRRVFAAGKYNKAARTLVVASATDLELLPKKPTSIPTLTVTRAPTPELSPTLVEGGL